MCQCHPAWKRPVPFVVILAERSMRVNKSAVTAALRLDSLAAIKESIAAFNRFSDQAPAGSAAAWKKKSMGLDHP